MKNLLREPTAVRWLPWSAVAFERARVEGKVILLSLHAAWSHACHDMDAACYVDHSIAEEINNRFVPVRVDADRRPDIAERYDLGGLPTTAFLDGEGNVLGGGTFVPPQRLRAALTRVALMRGGMSTPNSQVQTPNPDQAREQSALGVGSLEFGVDSIEALTTSVFESFDHQHAGFGGTPKFPLAAPVRLALELSRESGSGEMADYAARTLDAMGWSALYDEDDGGFFRCSIGSDWQQPQREKLLVTNAALLDLYLEAGVTMANERWLGRAADVLEYVQTKLASAPGEGWRASEESDGARLSDVNAMMVSAALHASRVFGDETIGGLALQSLETVLLATYRPGQGVAHCRGGVRGLLTDHVAMITAQLDAWDMTGNIVYRMMAEELAHFAVRTMWDQKDGGFFDCVSTDDDDALGLLRRRLKPFVLNCEAAEAIHRLSLAAEDATLSAYATRALDSVQGDAVRQGPLAAAYVRARRALSR